MQGLSLSTASLVTGYKQQNRISLVKSLCSKNILTQISQRFNSEQKRPFSQRSPNFTTTKGLIMKMTYFLPLKLIKFHIPGSARLSGG